MPEIVTIALFLTFSLITCNILVFLDKNYDLCRRLRVRYMDNDDDESLSVYP